MTDAQCDALEFASLPRRDGTVDLDVAGMKAKPRQRGQPCVEDLCMLGWVTDGQNAGDVDERGEESIDQVAGVVALSGKPDDGLGQVALAVGVWAPLFQVGIKGLDRGDRKVGLAVPPQRQRGGGACAMPCSANVAARTVSISSQPIGLRRGR